MLQLQWKNTKNEFGLVAKLLHWGMGMAILGMLVLGFVMTSLPDSPDKWDLWYMLHKSIGVTLLGLFAFRLLWRGMNEIPHALGSSWSKRFSTIGVYVLYGGMGTMLLSGLVMSQAGGHPISFFALCTVPRLMPLSQPLAEGASAVHYYASFLFLAGIATHTLATLYHGLVLQDGVLAQMAFTRKKG